MVIRDRVERKIMEVLAAPAGPTTPTTTIGADQLAQMIDHTVLKPEASESQIAALCQEAREYRFGAVCVNPVHVSLCRKLLEDTETVVATVAGFPLGATLPEVKAYEAQRAISAGAAEVDMVINIGAVKDHAYALVLQDVSAVVQTCHAKGAILKVIIEAALLTDEEKIIACTLAQEAGADFVKTSTGFGPGGATTHDLALMRRTVGPVMGIKAAGGIRSYPDVLAMVSAGATRIGASAGVKIIQEARAGKQR